MLVVRNSAAFYKRRGIPTPRPGAILVAINGRSVEGETFDRTVALLQDPPVLRASPPPWSVSGGPGGVGLGSSGKGGSSGSLSSLIGEGYTMPAPPGLLGPSKSGRDGGGRLTLRWREVSDWPSRDTLEFRWAGLEAALVAAPEDASQKPEAPLLRLAVGAMAVKADVGVALPWRWLGIKTSARFVFPSLLIFALPIASL